MKSWKIDGVAFKSPAKEYDGMIYQTAIDPQEIDSPDFMECKLEIANDASITEDNM